jgi:precorrin-3B C17-methyltransferase
MEYTSSNGTNFRAGLIPGVKWLGGGEATLDGHFFNPNLPTEEIFTTPMRGELERCRRALERARAGADVALVCSGDAEVYGMAGPLLQLAEEFPEAEVAVIPGVTAALSGGALLGAPLGHDFCVISLSDLMTPWEVIEKRLVCAAEGDFAICLYNPASRKRRDYLRRACDILLRVRSGETVCGVVRNIGRTGQGWQVLSLADLREYPADMFTTVFIGSSRTMRIGGRMVTPRGYRT